MDSKLLPQRHPQRELFLCDLGDVVLKDDLGSMEHPIFSLSKRPDTQVRVYKNGDKWLEVVPSVEGLATIWDKDVLIFAVSQLMAAKKQGREITRHLQFSSKDFLVFSNRATGGGDYKKLQAALDRLAGTRMRTNVETNGIGERQGSGLIEGYRISYSTQSGRVLQWELTLSEWLFRAVEANEVLTLHHDYFRLKSSLERRVYEIARKHCGSQAVWKIRLSLLRKKSGSQSPERNFRIAIQRIVDDGTLPDYDLYIEGDQVIFENRAAVARLQKSAAETAGVRLDPDVYHDARQVAPGWDIHALEQEWRDWMTMGDLEAPKHPEKAFLGFCRKWVERHG